MTCRSVVALLVLVALAAPAVAIEGGKPVVTRQKRDGWSWDAVTVTHRVAAEPVEVAAVHADFDRHWQWSPGVKVSSIVKREAPATLDVRFEYRDDTKGWRSRFTVTHYTMRVSLERAASGYRTRWQTIVIEKGCLERVEGEMTFEPHDSGTLLTMVNVVEPCTTLFGLLGPDEVVESSRAAVTSLGEHVRRLKAQPEVLSERVQAYRAALR